MKVFSGKLVIDLATVVENDNNKAMEEEAHQELTDELFNELKLLLGSRGYWASSIGVTLVEDENSEVSTIKVIKSKTDKAKKDIYKVYNKANIKSHKID